MRTEVVLTRQLMEFPERFGVPPLPEADLPPALGVLKALATELPGSSYPAATQE